MNHLALPRPRPVRTVAAIVAVLLAGALAAGCGGSEMNHDSGRAAPSASAGTVNDADVAFAQNMIPHHAQAVTMADLAVTRASDPQVRDLAADIKAAQQPEIDMLTGWLSGWGHPSAPAMGHGGMTMPGMMSDEEMGQLARARGVEFDRMFARMMIAHHNGAIQMAKEEQSKGANPDAVALATTIERAQSAEVGVLEQILDRL